MQPMPEERWDEDEPDAAVLILVTRYAATIGASIRFRWPLYEALQRIAAKEAADAAQA